MTDKHDDLAETIARLRALVDFLDGDPWPERKHGRRRLAGLLRIAIDEAECLRDRDLD